MRRFISSALKTRKQNITNESDFCVFRLCVWNRKNQNRLGGNLIVIMASCLLALPYSSFKPSFDVLRRKNFYRFIIEFQWDRWEKRNNKRFWIVNTFNISISWSSFGNMRPACPTNLHVLLVGLKVFGSDFNYEWFVTIVKIPCDACKMAISIRNKIVIFAFLCSLLLTAAIRRVCVCLYVCVCVRAKGGRRERGNQEKEISGH